MTAHGLEDGECRALLPMETYNAIISDKWESGWLKLKNVYRLAGKSQGYGKDCIIKIENIERIIPLSAEARQSMQQRGTGPLIQR